MFESSPILTSLIRDVPPFLEICPKESAELLINQALFHFHVSVSLKRLIEQNN
jgi:hypothetical protein